MSDGIGPERRAPGSSLTGYFGATRGAWYGFLFALPILAAYEALEFVFQPRWLNGADAMLRTLLAGLGPHERSTVMLVVLAVCGLLCWILDGSRLRREGRGLHGRYFVGMLTESVVYALFLGQVVTRIMRLLAGDWSLQMAPQGGGFLFNVTMAMGAGIYEELVFRVLILGGLMLVFSELLKIEKVLSWVLAVLLSSLLFSLFHYVGFGSEPFGLESFIFRFIAGAVLATLFALRGFGIAVWTHSLYDLLVMFQL